VWYLTRIHTKVCRTPFWTHISDIIVGTYSDLFKQWESIPPEIQKNILPIHMARIDATNSQNWNTHAVTQSYPGTIINDENPFLRMDIVYVRLMVYYSNTSDGKLTNFIPCVNGSKIMIRMAFLKTHI
jgi:hypothetical protein